MKELLPRPVYSKLIQHVPKVGDYRQVLNFPFHHIQERSLSLSHLVNRYHQKSMTILETSRINIELSLKQETGCSELTVQILYPCLSASFVPHV